MALVWYSSAPKGRRRETRRSMSVKGVGAALDFSDPKPCPQSQTAFTHSPYCAFGMTMAVTPYRGTSTVNVGPRLSMGASIIVFPASTVSFP